MKRNEELETIKKMVIAWKGSYLDIAGEVGGGDFLWKDFLEEIEELASPYVMRLYRTGAVEADQLEDFMGFCRTQVEELSKTVGEEGKHG